ncbi:hypothetical protein OIU76_011425 [Salix suchowensis]|nr:hypothetical protein OIU76_011425 [Salix suchowensis]
MQKSPSFDLDPQDRSKDRRVRSYQDKNTVESSSNQANVSLQSPRLLPQYNKESIREKPVEEKVIALERSEVEVKNTISWFLESRGGSRSCCKGGD